MLKTNQNIKKISENSDEIKENNRLTKLIIPKLIFTNNINKELEINNIKYNSKKIINANDLYGYIDIFTLNIYITKIKYFKIEIPKNYFKILKIYPDGNCFFRSESKFFSGSKDYYYYFRNITYNYIIKNKNELIANNSFIEYAGEVIEFEDYINKDKKDGNYSGK